MSNWESQEHEFTNHDGRPYPGGMTASESLSPEQFHALGGKRATVDVAALAPHLGLQVVERGRLGSGSYNHTGESIHLEPGTPVLVRQGRVRKTRVQDYVDALSRGESVPPTMVTDRAEGGLHHLDGLHKLVAARLLGRSVHAHIWR